MFDGIYGAIYEATGGVNTRVSTTNAAEITFELRRRRTSRRSTEVARAHVT